MKWDRWNGNASQGFNSSIFIIAKGLSPLKYKTRHIVNVFQSLPIFQGKFDFKKLEEVWKWIEVKKWVFQKWLWETFKDSL